MHGAAVPDVKAAEQAGFDAASNGRSIFTNPYLSRCSGNNGGNHHWSFRRYCKRCGITPARDRFVARLYCVHVWTTERVCGVCGNTPDKDRERAQCAWVKGFKAFLNERAKGKAA